MNKLSNWLTGKKEPGRFIVDIIKPNSLCVIRIIGDESSVDRVATFSRALHDISKRFHILGLTPLLEVGKKGSYTSAIICSIQSTEVA